MIEQIAGGVFFILVSLLLAVLLALAIYESWALFYDRRPITSYVREGIAAHPHWAAAAAFCVGLLGGHFYWR